MEAFEALEVGDRRQAGRYRIVARLGAAGTGRVYLERSPGGWAVAVKVVRPELADDGDFRRRFARAGPCTPRPPWPTRAVYVGSEDGYLYAVTR
ncbi:hypothetical protein ACFV2U_49470 [Streptomyces sp. NPDC059697]|uniref:hypothetical protein n=1 Tax=Streptomyces sp. NPDC059697 TaxID=3346912 RepID=UPI00368A6A7C